MTFGGSSGGRWRGMLLATLLVALPRAARADDAPANGPYRFGIGWHAGNGLGFFGGSVAVPLADRVTLEVQLGYDEDPQGDVDVTTYGVASLARVSFLRRSVTPFVAAGVLLRRATAASLSVTQPAVFASFGPEWRRPSGAQFVLGLGVGYARSVRDSNAAEWLEADGGVYTNLEIAVRYVFR